MNNKLQLPVGGSTGITSEGKLLYPLETKIAGDSAITSIDNVVNILSFADSGGDLLVTTSAAHNLSPGDLVNIKDDTVSAYTQLAVTVITTSDTDEFTISGIVDREGIEPSTPSLRTKHYTPKPPALKLLL